MEAKEAKRWVKKIVNQRKKLLACRCSKRNPMLCANIVQRLEKYLNAYDYKGNSIFGFIRRNYTDILLIIPGNNSEDKNLKILQECVQNLNPPTT
ncbi:MAG: hypothetical protein PHD06_11205 [Bacteroidales bacterium]|nr:hypothetical protein [Bacteroidales bacterium]